MVKKGLKVGAIFEDGGRKYRILEVSEDGTYISKAVTNEDVEQTKAK